VGTLDSGCCVGEVSVRCRFGEKGGSIKEVLWFIEAYMKSVGYGNEDGVLWHATFVPYITHHLHLFCTC